MFLLGHPESLAAIGALYTQLFTSAMTKLAIELGCEPLALFLDGVGGLTHIKLLMMSSTVALLVIIFLMTTQTADEAEEEKSLMINH